MIVLTKKQRKAVFRVFQRDFPGWLTPTTRVVSACPHCGQSIETTVFKVPSKQYRRFRKTVVPGPGCVMLPWQNMWLGIEPDGYTHS
jgi:hypothetical protein